MSDWLTLLLLTMGVYRAAHMAVYEDGPFEMFTELRSWAVSRFGNQSWVVKGLNCPLCTSFWLSAIGAFSLLLLGWPVGLFLHLWFGVAGAALLLDSLIAALYRIGGRE